MKAPEEEEAAYLAERARLQGLLQRAAAAAQDGGQGAEEDDGVDESGEEEGVRFVRVKPCADPGEEAEVGGLRSMFDRSDLCSAKRGIVSIHPTGTPNTQLHALLRTEAGAKPLPWCPPHDPHRVWALPAAFRLAPWPPYRAGRVYGMDAASAAAVWALGPQPGEHVLDLCCAPGLKLSAIADALAGAAGAVGGGSLTGVDVSRARLAVARKVAVKYRVGRPRPPPPPTTVGAATASSCGGVGSGGGGDADAPGASAAGASHQPPSSLTCRLLCADGVDFALGPLAPWDGAEEDVVFDSRGYDWQVSASA